MMSKKFDIKMTKNKVFFTVLYLWLLIGCTHFTKTGPDTHSQRVKLGVCINITLRSCIFFAGTSLSIIGTVEHINEFLWHNMAGLYKDKVM